MEDIDSHCYLLSRDDSEHRVSSKGIHQLASLYSDEAAKKLRIIKHNKNIVMDRLFLCDFQTIDLTQTDFFMITNFGKKQTSFLLKGFKGARYGAHRTVQQD